MFKNYQTDGNKEMIALGMMNMVGSCTSCYVTTGPFSRSAVNFNAGCKTAVSNIVMAMAVLISLLRVLLFVARPRTFVLGNIPNSATYRSIHQYPVANNVPGVLILQIDAPIYFANASYLRERISRWIDEEEDRLKVSGETSLQYVILDMSCVGSIDTSGISRLEEVKKIVDRRGLKLVLANPGSEVMKKLDMSKFIENIGQEWIYLTVQEAVARCNFMLHTCKSNPEVEHNSKDNNV
ncbi:hypothetical protein LWI29_004915 [Acer saccharum]|uniref:STAS domain-containing protein n=1 Tax=Acer saccharum TaxID=4024 RepID=A0AA39RNW6_ACESA|nr:hypothetical protein LWI29_004915 [Acer saccharum]